MDWEESREVMTGGSLAWDEGVGIRATARARPCGLRF